MALTGSAVVAIWNDITPEGRENFLEWHDREHIPERVGIDGFHRGRRMVAETGAPEFFTLYEARDATVLTGPDYLARLNSPTDWTRRSTAYFRNTLRGICTTVWDCGQGNGGYMATLRFDAAPAGTDDLRSHLVQTTLPPLAALPGVRGLSLCIADRDASTVPTTEAKGREVGVPNWIILIEGVTRAGIEAAADALLRDATLLALAEDPQLGIYRLEFLLPDGGASERTTA